VGGRSSDRDLIAGDVPAEAVLPRFLLNGQIHHADLEQLKK
jgi:hypothetical protein